jgi:hypothetical protein
MDSGGGWMHGYINTNTTTGGGGGGNNGFMCGYAAASYNTASG